MSHDAIRGALGTVLAEMGAGDAEILLERPRDPTHGDVASNITMTLTRTLRRAPRQIAEERSGAPLGNTELYTSRLVEGLFPGTKWDQLPIEAKQRINMQFDNLSGQKDLYSTIPKQEREALIAFLMTL